MGGLPAGARITGLHFRLYTNAAVSFIAVKATRAFRRVGGVHLHHFVWGIFLMLGAGFVGIGVRLEERRDRLHHLPHRDKHRFVTADEVVRDDNPRWLSEKSGTASW